MEDKTLDEKFETIVNDPQLHVDFLDWYKEKVSIKEPPTFWQNYLPLIMFAGVFIIAVTFLWYTSRDRVEQEVFIRHDGTPTYLTVVWVDRQIMESWFDPITLSDSLKKVRKMEGERILKTIK
jgi:hypothetical protein